MPSRWLRWLATRPSVMATTAAQAGPTAEEANALQIHPDRRNYQHSQTIQAWALATTARKSDVAGTVREGLSVVVHGMATESTRVCAQDVFLELSQQIAL